MYIIIGDNMYSSELICNILIYIDKNLKNKISIEDLENTFFYNRYYIMKLFKQEIKLTINEYINSLKINYAIKLIKETDNSFLNIALSSGFNSLEYFSEMCKKVSNANPTQINNYFKNKKKNKEEINEKITSSIISLYDISKIKENYLSKRKPKEPQTKILSIF